MPQSRRRPAAPVVIAATVLFGVFSGPVPEARPLFQPRPGPIDHPLAIVSADFNRDGIDDLAGTEDDDRRLASDSPCVDGGGVGAIPGDVADLDGDADDSEALPLDADGNTRVIAASVDVGAYEFGTAAPPCAWECVAIALCSPLTQSVPGWKPPVSRPRRDRWPRPVHPPESRGRRLVSRPPLVRSATRRSPPSTSLRPRSA